MIRLLILIFIVIAVEIYAFKGMRHMTAHWDLGARRIASIVYWLSTVICFGLTFYMMSQRQNFAMNYKSYGLFNFTIGFFFLVFVSKLLFGTFHLINDIASIVISWFQTKPMVVDEDHQKVNRLQFFNQLGLGITGLYAVSALYGFTKGKYGFRVCKETIYFDDLPASFDGLKIVQVSDMHLGSFNGALEDVQAGFDLVNSLNADYVFFTTFVS